MTVTEKRRKLKSIDMHFEQTYNFMGSIGTLYNYNVPIRCWEVTSSEGHRWPKDRGVRDAGGPFDNFKQTYWNNLDSVAWDFGPRNAGGILYTYHGNRIPYVQRIPGEFQRESIDDVTVLNQMRQWVAPSSNLMAVGSELIAKSLPTNPVLDGSVAFAELYREGLPRLFGGALLRDRVGFLRGLGSEYLNFEFGWKPLIADLKDASKAIIDSKSILDNLAKHSGRDLKRVRILPDVKSTDVYTASGLAPDGLDDNTNFTPSWYRETTTTYRRQWFSGCFTYLYEPGLMTEVDRIATQARLLYGLELSPEVVWNLAPWSWLVDWVSNVGPVLSNLTAFQQDGLVMKYGYVMEFNSKTVNRRSLSNSRLGAPSVHEDTFRAERKIRMKASPFGFGIADTSFTNRQWAILGALGMTRAPRTLA